MSVWDNLKSFTGHLVHGDLSGALGDVENAAQGAVGAVEGAASDAVDAAEKAAQLAKQLAMQATAQKGKGAGTVVPPPPSMAGDHGCCNRFNFSDGFLVDGTTGRVWHFNATSGALEEVPVVNHKAKQGLVNSMIESKLSCLRSQYEKEVLATIAPAQRQASLAQFEKDYLDPLRAAAQAVTY